MSYCRVLADPRRFGLPVRHRSDVYVWGDLSGDLICAGPVPGRTYMTGSRTEMLKYLHACRQSGYKVPRYATRRLKREIRQLGDDSRRR